MGQTWENVLLAHWPVSPVELRAVVPAEVPIDVYAGEPWVTVTPFVIRGLHLRGAPPIPVLSQFPELNARTYVTIGDRPGIWFFSLDAARRAAVAAARRLYRLPYFHARMSVAQRDGWVEYRSRRADAKGPPALLSARYRGLGAPRAAAAGSLDHWLAERYCLYTLDRRRRLRRAEIHHGPWPLQDAEAEIAANTMLQPLGVALRGEPLVHFAARQDVVFWPLGTARASSWR